MSARYDAVDLMTHYFRLLAEKSGVHWDSDNDREIEKLVDKLIEAATDATCSEIADNPQVIGIGETR